MNTTKKRLHLAVSSALGCLVGSIPAVSVMAQEPQIIEEVLVTGSRIARVDFVSNSPVTTLGAEQFALTGTVNTENLLNTLPQVVPGFDRSSNNPGNGTAEVDLRGLGTQRTLVLMDGVRVTPSSLGGVVDLNNIPAALIERVEVVTGGASAVYGSDAMAGVVNFIMKKDFEGVDLRVGHEVTERGDSDNNSLALTFGGNFADGRGNAVMSLGYNDRKQTLQGARDFSSVALLEDGAGGLEEGGSSLIPQLAIFNGGFTDFSPSTGVVFDGQGGIRPFVNSGSPNDFYNYAPVNFLQLPQERFQASGFGSFEVNDNVELYARTSFANSRVNQQLAPTPVGTSLSITVDGNPFLNSATQQILSDALGAVDADGNLVNDANGNGIADDVSAVLRRRQNENGPRIVSDSRTTWQFLAGMRGDLTDTWSYDVYFSEGRFENNTSQLGNLSRARLQQSLLLDVSDPNNITCRDTSGDCQPINIYGPGLVTQEAADFISTRVNAATDITQRVFAANVVGDTGAFELPGGPIGIAAGYEFIFNRGDFRPSQDLATGNIIGFNGVPPVGGQFNSKSFYVEAYAPILSNVAFADILAVEAAYRYSDYSTVGGVEAFKLAGEWAPIEDIRFRTSFNTAVRAPSLSELFSPQGEGFPSAQDPCSAIAFANGGFDVQERTALCAATGVPANALFSPALNAISGQVRGLFGGNPELSEEEAETFTIGVVVSPSAIPGLVVSVDYFDIEITEAVASFGGGVASILDICYDNAAAGGAGSAFCNAVNRRPDGSIEFVEATTQNIAALQLSGIDIAVEYGWDTTIGTFAVNYLGTLTEENSFTPFAGAEKIECAGRFGQTCATPDPDYRHRATLRWGNNSNITAQLVWEYIGSSKDDLEDPDAFAVTRLSSESYFDGSVSMEFMDSYTVTFGVNNLLDTEPPILGENAEQGNTFPNVYDPFGRTFFLSLGASF